MLEVDTFQGQRLRGAATNRKGTMLRTILSLASLAVLAVTATAGSKTVYGTVYGIGDSAAEAVPIVTSEGTSATEHTPALLLVVPKWDGKSAQGQVVGYHRLREVRLSFVPGWTIEMRGEWLGSEPTAWWQHSVGIDWFVGSNSDGSSAAGGGVAAMHTRASQGLGAFDGAIDGFGPSGWWPNAYGGYGTVTILDRMGGADRQEIRAWAGVGSTHKYLLPRFRSMANGLNGHWLFWGTARAAMGENTYGTGLNVKVEYVFEDGALGPAKHIVEGPWIDLGIGDGALTASLTGWAGDPAKLSTATFERSEWSWFHFGLENTSNVAGQCAGSAGLTDRYVFDQGGALICSPSATVGIGGGPVIVQAFDGVLDFTGPSSLTGIDHFTLPETSTHAVAPSLALGASVGIRSELIQDHTTPQPVTPGTTFAWWGQNERAALGRLILAVAP